jgi:ABC-type multidrug transport system ATPase subunit
VAALCAVRTVGLRKTYASPRGEVAAVRGVDLEIPDGELFGLLGPNGAGKSTTIGMLTTLVLPTSGTAFVCGLDVVRRPVEVKRRIGMVSQSNTLDQELSVAENLEFRGRYFGLSRAWARRRADELLALFTLTDRRAAMPFELSGGQAKRLMICRALVHRPEVLFLDEPTAGLDPQTRVNLWDTLRDLRAEGQTILLTTHYMEEAEALCDRVAILDHGSLLACDTVERLRDGAGTTTAGTTTAGTTTAGTTTAGTTTGVTVGDAAQRRPSLETVFLALTGREYRE